MPVAHTNTSRKLRSSVPAFQPSVYTTGTQKVRPYTPAWSEGVEYGNLGLMSPGELYDWWAKKGTEAASTVASAATGAAKYAAGALTGVAQAAADAVAKAKADQEAAEKAAREAEEAEKRKQILMGVGLLVAGVTGIVLVQRYRKTGKVF